MFKILFLILFVMNSLAFAQTKDNASSDKTSNAKVFDEFAIVPNGQIRFQMDSFLVELQNDPDSQGYIINYGTKKDVSAREKFLRNHLFFRKFDAPRITFVNGGFREAIKTVLWIVPAKAELPTIESASKKIDEFGMRANGDIKAGLDSFFVELQDHPNKKVMSL